MMKLNIQSQPDSETCGPTSLHAIYKYYGDKISLDTVIQEVERSISGGTLAPMLGCHALGRGYEAVLYINNLNIFDPTWFEKGQSHSLHLFQKLQEQLKHTHVPGVLQASHAYMKFLELGGQIYFKSIDVNVLKLYFNQHTPILAGLDATYLYRCSRERYTKDGECIYDDIRGQPCGHFVVLCGYHDKRKMVVVADPHRENPLSHDHFYKVSSHRLINSIMLGVMTYDANLLIIKPKEETEF